MSSPRHTLTVVEGRAENQRIVDDFRKAAEARGLGFRQISYINSDKLARLDFSDLPLDLVIFRDLSENNYTEAERFIYYLRKHQTGINLNPTGARAATSDKHFQQCLFLSDPFLRKYALPTYEAKNRKNVLTYVKAGRVSFPIVLKHRFGTAGKDITLIRNASELEKIHDFNDLLIEQYIEPECDYRVFVVGGTAVSIIRKTGDKEHPEDFRSWSGGLEKSREEDPEMIETLGRIACLAAAVSGLEYAGVDIVRAAGSGKLYLLETNFAAGWLNLSTSLRSNIPDAVIDWLEERADNKDLPQAIEHYISHREEYLPEKVLNLYHGLRAGDRSLLEEAREYFKYEDSRYPYDTGTIFQKLEKVYGEDGELEKIVSDVESLPLSWAGNFIGPTVGTLEQGAILSAMYLFSLGKIKEV